MVSLQRHTPALPDRLEKYDDAVNTLLVQISVTGYGCVTWDAENPGRGY